MSLLKDKYRHRVGWESAPASAFCPALRQHSSRRGAGLYPVLFSYVVLPYSATKRITVFKTARGRAAFDGREVKDVWSRRVSSTHACKGRRSRRSEISSSGLLGFGWELSGRELWFSGRGFHTRDYFLFWRPCSRLSGCCGLGLGLLRPGLLSGGGHFRLPGHLRNRLRRGIWFRGRRGGSSLGNTPSSNNVAPSLT